MVGSEEGHLLDPVETLRTMVALRDSNPSGTAKRLYALANPQTAYGRVSRYVLDKEAFTIDILVHELKMPKPTLYNVIRELEAWSIVYRGYILDSGVPGAKPIMYVLAEADPSLVSEAHKFHLELRGTSEALGLENPLRKLVSPIVERLIENREVVHFPGAGDSFINLKLVRGLFFKEHGYFPDDLPAVAKKVIEDHGFKMIQES